MAVCPDCGLSFPATEWKEDEAPLPEKPASVTQIKLFGDSGELTLHKFFRPMEVGAPMFASATSRHKCMGREQCILQWKGESCYVSPIEGTKNATAINGTPISGETEICQGDLLQVCGRSSGVVGASFLVLYYA